MEIGVKNLTGAQHFALARLRLLDLHDHVGLGEDRLRRVDHLGSRRDVFRIDGADPEARLGLDQHPVSVAHRLAGALRRHSDAVFVILDLLRHADQHGGSLHSQGGRTIRLSARKLLA